MHSCHSLSVTSTYTAKTPSSIEIQSMTTTSFSQDNLPIDADNDTTALRPLQALSLEDRAYKRIEKMILSGELKGAERINDTQLAKAFSTSRGPVRNALARLAEAGLIELIPYRGAFVKKIDLDDVMEIYEARAAIERAGLVIFPAIKADK